MPVSATTAPALARPTAAAYSYRDRDSAAARIGSGDRDRRKSGANDGGRPSPAARRPFSPGHLLACAAMAASIWALTASMLKLAPFCIGGYSMKVIAPLPTSCWTKTKRQNS